MKSRTVAVAMAFSVSMFSLAADAEKAPDPAPNLKGRLVYRDLGGGLRPIRDARVMYGLGDVSCLEQQPLQGVAFGADGSFDFPVHVQVSYSSWSLLHADGSADPAQCSEDVSYGCYRFKAVGCDDLVVKFRPEVKPHDVYEMRCPGRQRPVGAKQSDGAG